MEKQKFIEFVVKTLGGLSEEFCGQFELDDQRENTTIFGDKEEYPLYRLVKMLADGKEFEKLDNKEKVLAYETEFYPLLTRLSVNTYNNYIGQIMQEIHNRASVYYGVSPTHIEYMDFKDNPLLDPIDIYTIDAENNHIFVNSLELYSAKLPNYAKLQTIMAASFYNEVNQKLVSSLLEPGKYKLSDEDMFLVLMQAIHRFNVYEQFNDGKMLEHKYLLSFESMLPQDNTAYIEGYRRAYSMMKIGDCLSKKDELIMKDDLESYLDYMQDNLVVKSMKISKIELFAFLKNPSIKKLGSDFSKVLVHIFNELGTDYFTNCGASIEKGQTFISYLDYLDNRLIAKYPEKTKEYVSNKRFDDVCSRREELLTEDELESSENDFEDDEDYEEILEEEAQGIFDDYTESINDTETDDDLDSYYEKDEDNVVAGGEVDFDNDYLGLDSEICKEIDRKEVAKDSVFNLGKLDILFRDFLGEDSDDYYDHMNRMDNIF